MSDSPTNLKLQSFGSQEIRLSQQTLNLDYSCIQIYQPMKKVPSWKAIDSKPSSKSVSGSQSTLPHSIPPTSMRLIDASEKQTTRVNLDAHQVSLIVQQHTLSLSKQLLGIHQIIRNLDYNLQLQKEHNARLAERIDIQLKEIDERIKAKDDQGQSFPLNRRATIENKKLSTIENNVALLFQRFDQAGECRVSLGTEQQQTQHMQKLDSGLESIGIQIRRVAKQIRLEVAELHDTVFDLEETVHDHIRTAGDKMRMRDLQKTVSDTGDKVSSLLTTTQKINTEIQRMEGEVELHSLSFQKYEYRESKMKDFIEANISHLKTVTQAQSSQLQEFVSTRLCKVIESYNNNFEEMDGSISELREAVREILQINRLISQNLNSKLSNIIDNTTFHKTIGSLNDKFSETYLMNREKIQQLNSKQYEVEHQISYMKDILQGLKLDFRHNYSKLRLEEEVSMSDDGEDGRKGAFKKPNYIFPQRDSFNFTEERKKRASIDTNELGFSGRF